MKFYKKYKKVIVRVLLVLILVVIGAGVFNYLNSEYSLTIDEKTWIDENASSVLNVNVINDSNIFADVGTGVYYDFLSDFSSYYALEINPVVHKYGDETEGLTLGVTNVLEDDDVLFYEDHYVLLSKDFELINGYEDLEDYEIGILSSSEEVITNVLDSNYIVYETEDELIESFESDLEYIIVPRYLYADYIISNDYSVIYHMSDINYYYTLETDDSTLSAIMYKYFYSIWNSEVYSSIKENEFDLFVEQMNLTESELDYITSVDFTYGFSPNNPYEVVSSGTFGGVSAVLFQEFSDFSGVEFEFVKYKSAEDLETAIESGEVDVYLDKYNYITNYSITTTGFNESYVVVANVESDLILNSINGLSGYVVYAEKDSKIYDYLNNITGIKVVTYETEDDLLKLNTSDSIIVMDVNSFEYYSKNGLEDYTSRLTIETDFSVNYVVADEDTLYSLLDEFINIEDEAYFIYNGIDNHYKTISFGTLIASLAKYILLLLLIVIVVIILFIKKSKKIHIARKITKEDRLKYIDQLTSLKNRNYFNDQKDSWDKNTIYPQTIIIVDLNKIQKLNDQYGYNEGDKQIQTFANALIRTQLDNSDIMRTDGNEFVIYLVGYSQKQVVNYIHKLNKEVDKLPHHDGAKFGYSMILDNLKTVEDALNDAANDMLEKNKK